MKLKKYLWISLAVLSLNIGCGKDKPAPATPVPADGAGAVGPGGTPSNHSESMYAVLDAEEKLKAVGLRFKKDRRTQNGQTIITYNWDEDFFEEYVDRHPQFSEEPIRKALRSYIQTCRTYLQTYSGANAFENESDPAAARALFYSVEGEIRIKLEVAQSTVISMQDAD